MEKTRIARPNVNRFYLILGAQLVFICIAHPVRGSWVGVPEIEDMVEYSELILVGNVTYITPFQVGGIYRDVTLDVDECLKGPLNSSLVEIRIFGGDIYVSSPPDANFTVGERVLVFLNEENGNLRVVNFGFGKYLVIKGASYPLLQVKKILGIVDTSKVDLVDGVEIVKDFPVDVEHEDYGSERLKANLMIFSILVLILGGVYVAVYPMGGARRYSLSGSNRIGCSRESLV